MSKDGHRSGSTEVERRRKKRGVVSRILSVLPAASVEMTSARAMALMARAPRFPIGVHPCSSVAHSAEEPSVAIFRWNPFSSVFQS
jgi:hypothetical protein